MKRDLRVLAAAASLALAFFTADTALAQKKGGVLRVPHFDNPASMSLLEESTVAVIRPIMPVFNNLGTSGPTGKLPRSIDLAKRP